MELGREIHCHGSCTFRGAQSPLWTELFRETASHAVHCNWLSEVTNQSSLRKVSFIYELKIALNRSFTSVPSWSVSSPLQEHRIQRGLIHKLWLGCVNLELNCKVYYKHVQFLIFPIYSIYIACFKMFPFGF